MIVDAQLETAWRLLWQYNEKGIPEGPIPHPAEQPVPWMEAAGYVVIVLLPDKSGLWRVTMRGYGGTAEGATLAEALEATIRAWEASKRGIIAADLRPVTISI